MQDNRRRNTDRGKGKQDSQHPQVSSHGRGSLRYWTRRAAGNRSVSKEQRLLSVSRLQVQRSSCEPGATRVPSALFDNFLGLIGLPCHRDHGRSCSEVNPQVFTTWKLFPHVQRFRELRVSVTSLARACSQDRVAKPVQTGRGQLLDSLPWSRSLQAEVGLRRHEG